MRGLRRYRSFLRVGLLAATLAAEDRAGYEKRLCQNPADKDQGTTPDCIDWAALPAIAGDQRVLEVQRNFIVFAQRGRDAPSIVPFPRNRQALLV